MNNPLNTRRQFIRTTAAASLAGALLPSLVGDTAFAADDAGWIDAHVHIWHPDTDKYSLSKNFSRDDMQPPSFTVDELMSHCQPSGVKRIVLIQMSFYEYDHKYMFEAIKNYPGVFSGVALIDHRAPDVAERMRQLASQGARGFRLHSHGDADAWVDDPGMAKLWQVAAEEGLAVCPLINPTDIPYVDALCTKHPDTTVVVDHFARIGIDGTIPAEPLDNLCKLARFRKTHVKTSAFYALGKKQAPYEDLLPLIRRVCDSFGPERLMWASDCPFQVQGEHTYDASVALIRDRADFLSTSDKQQLLRGTAERVYFG